MADRAEIKITVDSREAQAEIKKQEDALKKAEDRRKKLKQRADKVARRRRGQGAAAGSSARANKGGLSALKKVVGSRTAARATRSFGATAKMAGGIGTAVVVGTEIGVKVAEVLPGLLGPFLEKATGGGISMAITEEVAEAMDEIRQIVRMEALTSQAARLKLIPTAGIFARAGDALSGAEAEVLGDQLVRESRRESFLSRQEARRSTEGITKAISRGILGGQGE